MLKFELILHATVSFFYLEFSHACVVMHTNSLVMLSFDGLKQAVVVFLSHCCCHGKTFYVQFIICDSDRGLGDRGKVFSCLGLPELGRHFLLKQLLLNAVPLSLMFLPQL
ncbi:hypothetical protein HN51_070678 [Arachis hypogaea]|nr:uncharacterized protein DS421_15g512770 [Arachis hypogaea]